MKKISVFFLSLCMAWSVQAQTPKFLENFETLEYAWDTMPKGWTRVNVKTLQTGGTEANHKGWWRVKVNDFLYGTAGQKFTVPPNGDNTNQFTGVFYSGGIPGSGTDSWLISPKVSDIKQGDYLSMWVSNRGNVNFNFQILISTTDKELNSFTDTITQYVKGVNAEYFDWTFISFSMADYIDKEIYLGFRVFCEAGDMGFGGIIGLDDIRIGDINMPSLGVLEIISPEVPLQDVTDSVEITVAVKNYGSPVSDVDLYLVQAKNKRHNTYTQYHKFIREMGSLDTAHFTFPRREMIELGVRDTLKVYVSVANDINRSDDTLTVIADNARHGTIPYANTFDTPDQMVGIRTFNVLRDNSTWYDSYDPAVTMKGTGCLRYDGNPNLDANDWIYTKRLLLDGGVTYELSFWSTVSDSMQPQKINAKWSREQRYHQDYDVWYLIKEDNLKNQIQPENNDDRGYKKLTARFTVEERGFYYIGLQCESKKGTGSLYVDDLKVEVAVGIDEAEKDNNVYVFPNPANNRLQIQSESQIQKIEIFNILGQQVISKNANNLRTTIDIGHLQNGLYMVKVQTENGETIKKINIIH